MDGDDQGLTEEERKRRAELLSSRIAEKYSPERLSSIVVDQAGRGEHLDVGTRSEMERRLGGNFGSVRIFKGPFAETVTRQHRADAVTIANTGMIMVREGPRSDPKTALGKALLAHELTHVRQAQSGMHFALEGGEAQDAPHEKEAEAIEAQVHAEATGMPSGSPSGANRGYSPTEEEKRRQIVKRVHELLEDYQRTQSERLGQD